MLLALLLAATTATEVARVQQDVAAAQLKRMQTEHDLLARHAASKHTMLRNQEELRLAQERVRAAERTVQEQEEH